MSLLSLLLTGVDQHFLNVFANTSPFKFLLLLKANPQNGTSSSCLFQITRAIRCSEKLL